MTAQKKAKNSIFGFIATVKCDFDGGDCQGYLQEIDLTQCVNRLHNVFRNLRNSFFSLKQDIVLMSTWIYSKY